MSGIALSTDALTFAFDGHAPVIKGLSLRVQRGDVLALVGANGTGKTTLLRLLAGLLAPSSGTATRESGIERLRHVPQDWREALFPWLGVQANVSLAFGKPADLDSLMHLIVELGFAGLPIGFATGKLSAGQQQAVVLLRAFFGEADLILLDEPFAALSPHWCAGLLAAITARAARGTAIVLTDHDPERVALVAETVVAFASDGEQTVLRGAPSSHIRQLLTGSPTFPDR